MAELFAERVAVVKSFLDCLANLDFERAGQHLTEDAVMALPFLDALPPTRGKKAILDQTSSTMVQMIECMKFTYDAWYDVRDSATLIAEYHSEATLKHGLGIYRNQYITVFGFDGDDIALYKEFLNPVNVAAIAPQG